MNYHKNVECSEILKFSLFYIIKEEKKGAKI